MTQLLNQGTKTIAWLVRASLAAALLAAPTASVLAQQEDAAAKAASATEEEVKDAAAVAAQPPPGATTEATVSAVAPTQAEEAQKRIWTVSAGGSITSGNAQTENYNLGTDYLWIRQPHQFALTFDYNSAVIGRGDDRQRTAQNVVWRTQYDWFFTKKDALWVAVGGRHDRFASIKYAHRTEGGYLRQWLDTYAHWLNSRIGYSFTYEWYIGNSNSQAIHGLLLATDYKWAISDDLAFRAGIQTVFNLNRLDYPQPATAFEDIRVAAYWGLTAQLFKRLSANIDFTLEYDRVPVIGAVRVDTTTVFSLAYSIL